NIAKRYLPTRASMIPETRYGSRIFCGSFSKNGNLLMTASQSKNDPKTLVIAHIFVDGIIRFYDPYTWKKTREIVATNVGWAVIDTDFSPDQRWLIYSGWCDSGTLALPGEI